VYEYIDHLERPRHRTVRLPNKGFSQHIFDYPNWLAGGVEAAGTVLYRLPQLLAASPEATVYVVEGEKDANRLAALGFAATTAPLGAGNWQPHYSEWLRDRHVVILGDNDDPGRQGAEEKARALRGIARTIKLYTFPDLPEGGDVSDWLEHRGSNEHLARLVETLPEWQDPGVPSCITLPNMMHVQAEEVRWLWRPYIPLAKVTLMDGDPGVGKSILTCAIAAAVTRGTGLPSVVASGEPGRVLLLAGEDGLGDTVRPRLEALGADCTLVRPVTGLLVGGRETGMMLSEDGMIALGETIASYRPELVIVDPLVAYTAGKVDMFRPNEVRSMMRPLGDLAEKHGCAILALRHLTKVNAGRALYRGQGNIDFVAAARSVLLVAADPDDRERRIIAPVKHTIGKGGAALAFRVDGEDNRIRFTWGGAVDITADALLAADPETQAERASAREFLLAVLCEGALPAKTVLEEAENAGIAKRTLDRAKGDLGIFCERIQGEGRSGFWLWKLPEGGRA
jgi:hypothetical protein